MQDFEWNTKYEVGNPRIDFEHRIFLDLIAQFAEQAHHGVPIKRLQKTCAEIYKYAAFHFFSEENMLEDAGYRQIDDHRKLHKDLLESLSTFSNSLSVDAYQADELTEFLLRWFTSHTMVEDTKHAPILSVATPYKEGRTS